MSMNDFINILACFGGLTIVIVLVAILSALFYIIKNFIQIQINKYKIKHRFDKPPIAECYCIDCKKCTEEEHKGRWCYRFERCVADNWFCWEAEPNIHCEYIKKGES